MYRYNTLLCCIFVVSILLCYIKFSSYILSNTTQLCTVQHNTVIHCPTQHSYALSNTTQLCTVQHNTVIHCPTQHSYTMSNTTQLYTVQHNTVIHCPTQHSYTLSNTTQLHTVQRKTFHINTFNTYLFQATCFGYILAIIRPT
jgi:rRNA maturation protein Nop10